LPAFSNSSNFLLKTTNKTNKLSNNAMTANVKQRKNARKFSRGATKKRPKNSKKKPKIALLSLYLQYLYYV